jgi:small nuclear ribonucleoprotein (snRNP)-like protein
MKTLTKCFALWLIAIAVHAQQPVTLKPNATTLKADTSLLTKRVKVSLKDGTDLIGILQSISGQSLLLKSDNIGEITLDIANIVAINPIEGFSTNGQFWFENPHPTRYFFAPSAYSLRKGEAYYQNAYLFVNSVTFGVTDNFTMGVGYVLNPTFKGTQVFFLTPKYSFPSKSKIKFGVGSFIIGTVTPNYNYGGPPNYTTTQNGRSLSTIGIVYGNATFGTKEHNASVGLGYGFANGTFTSSPVINFAYMNRFAKNVAIVSENWFLIADGTAGGIFSGGVRIFGERLAVDLALAVPASTGFNDVFIIPYIDVVYKFGKRK